MTSNIATYVLDVDWDNNGTFDGGDVTADLVRVRFVTGRQGGNILTGQAQAGELLATLRNDADKYSPFNSGSALSGSLLPGRLVRLRTTAPSAQTLWQGELESITPSVAWPRRKRVTLRALGPLARLTGTEVNMAMATSLDTGALVDDVLDAAGFPTGASFRDIAIGDVTVTRFWLTDRRPALLVIRELEATENGFLYESQDGKVVFDQDGARQADSTSLNSQATFSDNATGSELKYSRVQQEEPLAQVYNDIRATVTRYTVQAVAVLWTHPEATVAAGSPSIASGASLTVWARFPNPASATEAVAVDAWTTPVDNTDYEANTADDGTGTDISADISIVMSGFADAAKLVVTNNNASTAFLTLLQLRGTAVHADDPVTVQAEDATSQADYGLRTFRRGDRARWVPDTATAQSWASEQLELFKDPQPIMELEYLANTSPGHLTEALTRRLSHRITLEAKSDVGLGIEQDFYVERIAHDIDLGVRHRVSYVLSSTTAFDAFWIIGTNSVLGTSTRANYD